MKNSKIRSSIWAIFDLSLLDTINISTDTATTTDPEKKQLGSDLERALEFVGYAGSQSVPS